MRNLSCIKYQTVLAEDCEDGEQASKHPDIIGLQVGSRGGETLCATEHCDESEKSCDAESHPARDILGRDEEGEPGDEDKHSRWNKCLGNMKRQSSL